MATKADKMITLEACAEIAQRMILGFNDAVADHKGKLEPEITLTVGLLGALSALRSDTNTGWTVKQLIRHLTHKGVLGD